MAIEKHPPTQQDWEAIKMMYLKNYELAAIVKNMPNVSITTTEILKVMRRCGMDKKKKEINDRLDNTLIDAVVAERKRTSDSCVRAYKKGLEIIAKLLNDYRMEQEAGGIPKRCTAYNLDMLMSGINKIQKGFDVAFGEDKNGKLYEKEPDVFIVEGIDEKKL